VIVETKPPFNFEDHKDSNEIFKSLAKHNKTKLENYHVPYHDFCLSLAEVFTMLTSDFVSNHGLHGLHLSPHINSQHNTAS
jgi:hypothetical protein